MDFRDHPFDRLSRPRWFDDPALLREGIRAHRLFHEHARRGGMTERDEEMTDLVAAVRFIWANCRRLGLEIEQAECLELMDEISGWRPRSRGTAAERPASAVHRSSRGRAALYDRAAASA